MHQRTANPGKTDSMRTEKPEGGPRRPARSATRARDHAGPSDQGLPKNPVFLPDLRHRSGDISLKTLNEANPATELKQLCVPRRFREGVSRLDVQSRRAGKQSTIPKEGLCRDDLEVRVGCTQSRREFVCTLTASTVSPFNR